MSHRGDQRQRQRFRSPLLHPLSLQAPTFRRPIQHPTSLIYTRLNCHQQQACRLQRVRSGRDQPNTRCAAVVASALTNVDLDHQGFLGNTVAGIAREKEEREAVRVGEAKVSRLRSLSGTPRWGQYPRSSRPSRRVRCAPLRRSSWCHTCPHTTPLLF